MLFLVLSVFLVSVFPRKSYFVFTNIPISHISLSIYMSLLTCNGIGKFIKTFTNTTSFESSLEAAADEMVENENKLRKSIK